MKRTRRAHASAADERPCTRHRAGALAGDPSPSPKVVPHHLKNLHFCALCKNSYASGRCALGRCRRCCISSAKPCAVHAREKEIEQSVFKGAETAGKLIPVQPGKFHETALEYVGETATIFCARDFLENPKYSGETLDAQRRAQRRRGGDRIARVPSAYVRDSGDRSKSLKRVMQQLRTKAGLSVMSSA